MLFLMPKISIKKLTPCICTVTVGTRSRRIIQKNIERLKAKSCEGYSA